MSDDLSLRISLGCREGQKCTPFDGVDINDSKECLNCQAISLGSSVCRVLVCPCPISTRSKTTSEIFHPNCPLVKGDSRIHFLPSITQFWCTVMKGQKCSRLYRQSHPRKLSQPRLPKITSGEKSGRKTSDACLTERRDTRKAERAHPTSRAHQS